MILICRRFVLPLAMVILFCNTQAQTGNRVFSGDQFTSFGTINLATPSGKTWTTARSATPGYFAVASGAGFSGASDVNNVDGYVKKYGKQVFTFPVGTGSDLRTLTIGAPANTTDAYAAAWILGDPSGNLDPTGPHGGMHDVTSVTFPIKSVSRVGQWDWQAGVDMGATGTGQDLMITVSMPDMTAFSIPAGLRLVGWNGTSWIDLSGQITATSNTENSTLIGYAQPGISAIGIGSSYWVLPLKLLEFTVREQDCNASLNWTTTNEVNMDRFDIEGSDNGNSYHKVGEVKSKNGGNTNFYTFKASQTVNSAFYRLKMISADSSFTYSEVAHLQTNCKTSVDFVKVYPNPVTDGYVYVSFATQITGAAKLVLTDAVGRQVKLKDINITTGNNTIKLELNQVPKGFYFVQIIAAGNRPVFVAQKIIVE